MSSSAVAASAVAATAAMEATTAVEAASAMGSTPKAGLSARGKAAGISAVIESTERAGVRSGLRMRRQSTVESWISASGSASMKCIAVVKIAAVVIEIVVIEIIAIDDGAAMGDVGVVVVNRAVAVPIIIPVMPAPSKPTEKAKRKSTSEED